MNFQFIFVSTYLTAALGLAAASEYESKKPYVTRSNTAHHIRRSVRADNTRAADDTACLTLEDCQAQSLKIGIDSKYFYANDCKGLSGCGTFDLSSVETKGCYSKNGKAFFSLGSIDEMSTDILPPSKRERIWCSNVADGTTDPTDEPSTSPPITPFPTEVVEVMKASFKKSPCLTLAECKMKSNDIGVPSIYFYADDCKGRSGCAEFDASRTDSKGCFTKTSESTGITKAFFSLGTEAEMSTANLSAPLQERLWCDTVTDDGPTPFPTPMIPLPERNPTKAPSPKPIKVPTGKPTDIVDTGGMANPTKAPSPKPTKAPTKKPSPAPTVSTPAFICPSASQVGCTAVNPASPQDECLTVGEPCPNGNNGEYCCRDACPRNFCTAKQSPAKNIPDTSLSKSTVSANKAEMHSSGTTRSLFGTAVAVVLVGMSLIF